MGLDMFLFNGEDAVGQWRKANAIHNFFVETVQNGHDDCGEYPITREDLETLKLLCQDVLIDREDAKNILPTQSGFFFGSTEYDEDYFDKARYTLKVCEDALLLIDKGANLTYSSSW
jgi:hypothetical protein